METFDLYAASDSQFLLQGSLASIFLKKITPISFIGLFFVLLHVFQVSM